jgi:hypothetical protein
MFTNARTGQKKDRIRVPGMINPESAKRTFELAGWEFPSNAAYNEESGFFEITELTEKKKIIAEDTADGDKGGL